MKEPPPVRVQNNRCRLHFVNAIDNTLINWTIQAHYPGSHFYTHSEGCIRFVIDVRDEYKRNSDTTSRKCGFRMASIPRDRLVSPWELVGKFALHNRVFRTTWVTTGDTCPTPCEISLRALRLARSLGASNSIRL